MNIVIISSAAIPTPPPTGRYGGLERVTWALANGLAQAGHHVALVAAAGSRTPSGGVLLPYQRAPEILDRYATELAAADLVHDHGWELFGWAWAIKHPTQTVVQTWHGPSLGPTCRWRQPPANVTLVGLSRWHAWRLSAELRWPAVAVYNGIDVDAYPRRVAPAPDGPLLSLNRLDPLKGEHYARWAATQANRSLWLAGPVAGVPDPYYVEQVLRDCDGDQLVYLGDCDESAKIAALHRAACLLWLTPEYGEPFGLGVIEALACGVPVVAWHDGTLPELLTPDSGVLVESPWEIRSAINRAVTLDPARCRYQADQFSITRMVDTYDHLYRLVTRSTAAAAPPPP
jgi:glycosyltransferase involved in cell wall biosynthesis